MPQMEGLVSNFKRGIDFSQKWQEEFSRSRHKVAEKILETCIFEGHSFMPVVMFVRKDSFLTVPIAEYMGSIEEKEQLDSEIRAGLKRDQNIFGVIMIIDTFMRTPESNFEKFEAILTNAQWKDGYKLIISTKYVKKSDIEFSIDQARDIIFDDSKGRFCNFF